MEQPNNKPSWNIAPVWAKWLASDQDGMWYWYEKEPLEKKIFLDGGGIQRWNTSSGKFRNCGKRDPEWAKSNWRTSVEKKPELPVKPAQIGVGELSNKKRVTLFFELNEPTTDDAKFSAWITNLIADDLNDVDDPSVCRIHIAVGITKLSEVYVDEDGRFQAHHVKADNHGSE